MAATRNKRLIAAIVMNGLIVVLEVFAIGYGIAVHGLAENFVFYTECSNLFGGIACALCMIAEIRMLSSSEMTAETTGQQEARSAEQTDAFGLSRGLRWAKYASSCCLLMTLFVVTVVLAPMLNSIGRPGYYLMFVDGVKSITHLGAPLLVFISYVLFEADRSMTLKQSLIGFLPTLVYAIIAYACNILRLWDGPYPFFQVYNMPLWMTLLWFVALFVLAFGLCQLPRIAGNKTKPI